MKASVILAGSCVFAQVAVLSAIALWAFVYWRREKAERLKKDKAQDRDPAQP
jgi:hypothetical protein